jgi:hypothetical protein
MLDLDAVTARLSHERSWRRPAILDVGVSSGITTLDLRKAMISNGIIPSVIATDIGIRAAIVTLAPGIKVLVDASEAPLQYDLFGLAVRPWNRRLDYISGYWLLTKITRNLVSNRIRVSVREHVTLISRWVTSGDTIDFIEDDLAVRNPAFEDRFDIVRAANILNRGYFDTAKLKIMIDNLKSYARGPGALIIVNRTHQDGTNHGSIFEVLPDKSLHILRRVGIGSEVENLVCAGSAFAEPKGR